MIDGTEGNDVLFGTSGGDNINGLGGDDTIYGGDGNDVISGGDGNDILYGEAGNDWFLGGEGNDTIIGGTGRNQVYAHGGDDIAILEYVDLTIPESTNFSTLSGGEGTDTLRVYVTTAVFADDRFRTDLLILNEILEGTYYDPEDYVQDGYDAPESLGIGSARFKYLGVDVYGWDELEVFVDGQSVALPSDPPIVENVFSTADEDGPVVAGIFDGDDPNPDDDAASLTYTITSAPFEGSVINNGDGTFSFDPGSDFQDLALGETRDVTFDYTATDSHGVVSNTGTITVTVTGTNDAPVVQAVSAAATEDGPAVTVSFDGDDIDSDDDASTLTYTITTAPSEGSVINNGDGTFSFDPGSDFQDLALGETRDVTFDYTATDSHGVVSNTGTVTVTVTGTNDAPATMDDGGITVSSLVLGAQDGTDGFKIVGENERDFAARAVSGAGDVNGDGFADLIVGATSNDGGGNYAGAAYVVFGTASGVSLIDLDDVASGTGGFKITGETDIQLTGYSVSGAGDVNGDGFDDVIVGAFGDDTGGNMAGAAYVVFGSDSGISAVDLDDIAAGVGGFKIFGEEAGDRAGVAVSEAGDVNGDGFADLIVGADLSDAGGAYATGAAYVVFGAASGITSVDLDDVASGLGGFRIVGEEASNSAGSAVSSLGDLNDDGFDDLLIGAQTNDAGGNTAGAAYVVYGAASGMTSVDLDDIAAGTGGFKITGEAANDRAGISVSAAGDVNNDGIGDLLIGASSSDAGGNNSGAAYVVYGAESGIASVDLDDVAAGIGGFRITGENPQDYSGIWVSGAGDVNGDGIDDVILGARNSNAGGTNSGAAYVVFGAEGGLGAVDLGDVASGIGGYRLIGEATDNRAYSVSAAGDVNGDGFADVIVGAQFNAENPSEPDAGAAYVIFGSNYQASEDESARLIGNVLANDSDPDGDALTVSAFDATSAFGATITAGAADGTFVFDATSSAVAQALGNGETLNDTFSYTVSDGNGGIDTATVTVTVIGADELNAAPLALDDGGPPAAAIALTLLDGTDGFRLDGEATIDNAGWSVAGVGDINGDGLADVVVGAPLADSGSVDSGVSYVVFGSVNGFDPSLELADLDGTAGFRLAGQTMAGQFGAAVSGAGDFNGDGVDDLIVGAPAESPNGLYSGSSYVVFGSTTGFTSHFDVSSLDGSDGFRLEGETQGDNTGVSVSAAGDLNDDGFADLVVGAPRTGANGVNSGSAYVLFGAAGGFAPNFDLSSLDGSNGFQLDGLSGGDLFGWSVSDAGDVNGDGVDDLMIGAFGADPNGTSSGSSYIVFGNSGGFAASFDLSALDGEDGFRIDGEAQFDNSGYSVSGAGDVNGDGIDDLIVGARGANPNGNDSGSSYVIFGTSGGFAASLELSSLDGTNGFRLDGGAAGNYAGYSVSGAGDINGDGISDLIIGAPFSLFSGNPGAAYVVFGTTEGFSPNLNLSTLDGENGFRLDGLTTVDQLGNSVADAGDVNGDGFDDLIVGARGSDPNGNFSGSSYVFFGSNYQASEDDSARLIGNVLANDSDPDGDDLTVSAFDATSASGATITAGAMDGTFVFDATTSAAAQALDDGEILTDTFSYTISDGNGGFDTATVTVSIVGTNDAPVVQAVAAGAVEDGLSVTGSFDGDDIDSDDDGSTLSYTITSAPAEGSVVNNGNGTFSFDPGTDFQDLSVGEIREVSFTYTATDSHGAVSNTGIVTVTVTGTNDAPVVQALASTAEEDGPAISGGFIGDDVDSDDDASSLTYTITSSPGEGTVTNNNDGTFSFDPGTDFQDLAEGETRNVSFEYTATDSHGAVSDAGTVTVTVTGATPVPGITVTGGAEDDVIDGTDGDDLLSGGGGNDTITGRAGDDVLEGGTGADFMDGGAGRDTVSYASAGAGIRINLQQAIGSVGEADGDVIVNVEDALGSDHDDHMTGSTGENTLDGGAGNDILKGWFGNDTLYGGLGNDELSGDGDDDALHGGDGVDLLYGGAGNDALYGDAGDDELYGHAGNDVLEGGDGNDLLHGNDGDDTLSGGADADVLVGHAGTDTLNGGSGNDLLYGGTENDTLNGGADDDRLWGEDGDDTLNGGAGNDTLEGMSGDDVLQGEAGDDFLYGRAGNDDLDGGEGNDLLQGNSGDDILSGGTGDDYVVGHDGADTVSGGDGADFLFGGTGIDTLNGGSGNDTLFGEQDDDTLNGGAGNDELFGGSRSLSIASGNDTLDGGDGDDTLRGEDGDDILYGGRTDAGSDELHGGLGADQLWGGDGDDRLYGDDDDDVVRGEDGDDIVEGGNGNDDLHGGAGNDTMNGQSGNDVMYGDAGDDTLLGKDGDDVLHGGDGIDYLVAGTGNDTIHGDSGADSLFGQEGDDALYGGADNDTLYGEGGTDTLEGGDGDDRLFGGSNPLGIGSGVDTLDGGNGNDRLWAGDGNDILYGGQSDAGVDELYGGAGDDVLWGGDGRDYLRGEADDDELNGESGDDDLEGGAGNDTLEGGVGADDLDGGSGTDTVSYGASSLGVTVDLDNGSGIQTASGGDADGDSLVGFENITGSAHDDVLTGDSSINTILGGAGNDLIDGDGGADHLDGGAGIDTVSFAAAGVGTDLNLQHGRQTIEGVNHAVLNFENAIGSAHNDKIVGTVDANTISGGDGADNINGWWGDDVLSGGAGIDVISGHDGNDVLHGGEGDEWDFDGGAGNDTLNGDAGNDRLKGGTGEDVLNGGTGNDLLYGGADSDLFNFESDGGHDTIADFEVGMGSDDVVDLTDFGFSTLADLLATTSDAGLDTVITFDQDTSLTLIGVQKADLHEDDFLF